MGARGASATHVMWIQSGGRSMQHRLWDWMLRVSFGCDNSLAHVPVLAVSEVLWNLWVYTDPTTLPMTYAHVTDLHKVPGPVDALGSDTVSTRGWESYSVVRRQAHPAPHVLPLPGGSTCDLSWPLAYTRTEVPEGPGHVHVLMTPPLKCRAEGSSRPSASLRLPECWHVQVMCPPLKA